MIVAQAPKTYFGSDIQKALGSLPGFPWVKYPGEKHLPGHNYTDDKTFISNVLFSNVIKAISDKFITFKGQIELDGVIIQDGGHKQNMQFVGFNAKTFHNFFATLDDKSDASDWYFTDFTDSVPEEIYDELMNIVEIFVGKDYIDQMLQRLGKIDQKRLTLISHNGSGFANCIVLKNAKKLTQCPLVTASGILSLPLTYSFTDEY
ncbi:hypothetical protein LOTGIDRAFT_170746 [Lottia gigantea]|uniref:Uncharacterized protein n=1 Tax=Lottia gigantea TaxID=225164 RepID=V4BAJ0_LOTGI|nr:hypothetical protein LOTGIDRAFT_170746 [Lottia gigantea]ESP04501.1 hypothetical protein LOTGIDRAFT_170746 [Lottia gigantea]